MTYTITTITPQGEVTSSTQTAAPALNKLQEIVGGYIELIPYFNKYEGNRCIAYCNEEGKLTGLEFNETATNLWDSQKPNQDVLVGNICIISADQHLLDKL